MPECQLASSVWKSNEYTYTCARAVKQEFPQHYNNKALANVGWVGWKARAAATLVDRQT